jgi:hypothetical protein
MAPPIPGTRRAPTARRRSGGDVLLGVLAVLALLALAVGLPLGLLGVFGSPIPQTVPTLSSLSHPLDFSTILKVLSVIVWLAWLQLVVCVVTEIMAAVRNTGMPASVPLAGGTQLLVHRLVSTALLLVTATAVLSPALSHSAPAAAPHAVAAAGAPLAVTTAASPLSGSPATQAAGQLAAAQAAGRAAGAHAAHVDKIYVVKPPLGRYHESLWEIAHNHLGDGRRYREIYELNKDRTQPDGTRLTIASLIRPGWVLHMPRDAHGPGIEVVHHDSRSATHAGLSGDGPGLAASHGASVGGAAALGAGGHESASLAAGGHGPASLGAGGHESAGQGAGSLTSPGHPALASPAGHSSHGLDFADELAAASLLAAGVLAALGRRRREQLWQRAFGRQVAAPEAAEAAAEVALRLGAHEPQTRLLDSGLRFLSHALGAAGRTPPTVVAAHLGSDNLDLWVAPPDLSAPAPWIAADDGQVWRLPRSAADWIEADLVAGAVAPFPGLVSIGTDSSGRVMVDLEAAHGLICVAGSPENVTAVLSAMAVELATNCWSDQMTITLVGFGAGLVLLAPDRITAVSALDEALPAMEARAAQVADALAASGVGSVLTGRSQGINAEAWAPHYLIMATPPTEQEQRRLLDLAQVRHAAAAGYVVAGAVPGAAWAWEITPEGRLMTGLLGLDVAAQQLPPRQHAALAELFRAAARTDGVPLPASPADAVPAAQLVPGAVMPAEITLLGPVSVQTSGVIEPDRIAQATEIVVYLAAHPGGVHPTVLSGAIWPRGVSTEVRDAALSRAADWLGADGSGGALLVTDSGGRLRLADGVRVDWQVFRALAGRAELARDTAAEADYLARALNLIAGQLLGGRDTGRYAWLATDALQYEATARIADAAHRLCTLRLDDGDVQGAMDAARSGLRLAFDDELLWRDLLRGAHATGQDHLVRAVVDEVCARTALDEVLPRMAPQTEALIDEICPSWRASVA